jgi:xanthine dehydrogenase accessory factor
MQRFDWIDEAQRLSRAQQPFALVTVLRTQPPTSAKSGDKAVVTADGRIHGWIGGGCAQPTVIKTVRDALADGQPRNIRISPATETTTQQLNDVLEFGMACHSGGTLELFIEPMVPAAQLTIIGDSAVAKALAQLAPRVGLQVTVIAQDTTATAFPDATRVLTSDDPASLAALVDTPTDVVVATQGRRDLQGLKAALALNTHAVWFVASAKKAAVLKESLRSAGAAPDAVDAIIAPAGVPIGAQTPAEIALSVLTNVVATQRSRLDSKNSRVQAPPAPTQTTAAPATKAGGSLISAMEQALNRSCCGD